MDKGDRPTTEADGNLAYFGLFRREVPLGLHDEKRSIDLLTREDIMILHSSSFSGT